MNCPKCGAKMIQDMHRAASSCLGCGFFEGDFDSIVRLNRKIVSSAPTQEADGHFRGCARLGKCRCPTNAPRDEWRPE